MREDVRSRERTWGPRFGRERAEAEVAAIGEALARVEAWAEGRDLAEVEDALVRELRSLGSPFVPASEIKTMARRIAEPGRPQRDPDAWEARLADAEAEARVDRCRGVRSFAVGSHRTMDGFEFEVYIEPWSPRLARRVERRARPTAVVVKPFA